MKLVKGQASGYPMPPHSHIDGVWAYTDGDPRTNPESFRMAIPIVDLHRILQLREKRIANAAGVPMLMAIRLDNSTLEFFPTPDKDYEVLIRYAGPLQEI